MLLVVSVLSDIGVVKVTTRLGGTIPTYVSRSPAVLHNKTADNGRLLRTIADRQLTATASPVGTAGRLPR